ncbi:hypothetical protein B0T18DRAFT_128273 [Schizothecium vesticola]|uniref:Secreted protein n=1 Tax=Schizothecium vesticola TaxID=314040 RepID=A0AA40K970_9PEZI|nr:hypothetical protein B0T18DRAFT_128273 [Schizothecium vesticola]
MSCTWTAVLAHMAVWLPSLTKVPGSGRARAEACASNDATTMHFYAGAYPNDMPPHRQGGGISPRRGGGLDGGTFRQALPISIRGGRQSQEVMWYFGAVARAVRSGSLAISVGLQYRGTKVETGPKQGGGRRGGAVSGEHVALEWGREVKRNQWYGGIGVVLRVYTWGTHRYLFVYFDQRVYFKVACSVM